MENGFFNKNKIFSINVLYILSLLPIIIYGFIKNGILVAKNGYLSWFLAFQYIIIPIIIIVLSYVFETYYYLCIKKDTDLHNVYNSLAPYLNTLCYLVCGPTNYLWLTIPLIVIIDVILKFIDNKISINQVALFKCILFLILSMMALTDNANLYEASMDFGKVSMFDAFLGRGIGEIGTTSTLFAIIGFVILLFNNYYKKDIPILVVINYILACGVIYFASGMKFNEILLNTFNSGFMFIAVFISSISTATPVIRGGRYLYSILLGIISAIMIQVFKFNIGVYIVILVFSLFTPLFNKLKIALD